MGVGRGSEVGVGGWTLGTPVASTVCVWHKGRGRGSISSSSSMMMRMVVVRISSGSSSQMHGFVFLSQVFHST